MPVLVSPLEGYRLWSRTWESDPSPIVSLESRSLTPWLMQLQGKVVVDVSCGVGRWLAHAKAQGAMAFGMDLCREMLEEAKKKPDAAGNLTQADTRRLPLRSGGADLALCALSIGHMPPVESVVYELARIVRRPGGALIISDFHPDAIARGWKRTFRSNGQTYEIETQPYTKELLMECAARRGLILEEIAEPCFGEPEKEIFERAGKLALFEQVRHFPAVLLARWTRP
jgi:ubiquinone/menaquinone biosynthesis C-methylase UbiE